MRRELCFIRAMDLTILIPELKNIRRGIRSDHFYFFLFYQRGMIYQLSDLQGKVSAASEPSSEHVKFRAPVPGDHVVCLHQRWAYFMATVVSFDEQSMTYTVNWDDGDPSGRVQSYKVRTLMRWCSVKKAGANVQKVYLMYLYR